MPVKADFDMKPSPLVLCLGAAVKVAAITFFVNFW